MPSNNTKINKLDLWNTFSTPRGTMFKRYKRDELIMLLSRSVVTYWINSGYMTSAHVKGEGTVIILTPSGQKHLVETTRKWLHNKPDYKSLCKNPHPSFGVK